MYKKEVWEIKMCWSEYKNGKWSQKSISKEFMLVPKDYSYAINPLILP